jgi:hypothetical protein
MNADTLIDRLQGMQDTLDTCRAVKGDAFADTVKLMTTLSIAAGHAAAHRIDACTLMMQQVALMYMEAVGIETTQANYGELARMTNALGNQLEATMRCCMDDGDGD